MRWGLVPHWAKGVPPRHSIINASLETIDPSAPKQAVPYRRPWKYGQRCIILANGFYEWQDNGAGKRQPFYIRPNDPGEGASFMFAGLWESSTTADGVEILSCTIITMPANELMAKIHNDKQRMPAILEAQDVDTWLSVSPEAAHKVLKPYPSELMMAWRVSKKVNSPTNNSPELLMPLISQPPSTDKIVSHG